MQISPGFKVQATKAPGARSITTPEDQVYGAHSPWMQSRSTEGKRRVQEKANMGGDMARNRAF